jgi:hypothetical protein
MGVRARSELPGARTEIVETLAETGELTSFLRRARRRFVTIMALHQAILAGCVGMGGVVLLLLAGTQILDWYWPAALFAVTLIVGFVRIRKRVPTDYVLAQRIDRRLELKDTLSTAVHFADHGPSRGSELVPRQRESAESAARSADVALAIPYEVPRPVYVFAALIVIAGSMFGLRYGLTHQLNLREPIAQFNFDFLRTDAPVEKASRKSIIQERLDEQLKQMGLTLEKVDSPPGDNSQATDKAMPQQLASPDGQIPIAVPEKGVSNGKQSDPQDGGDPSEGTEAGQNAAPGSNEQSMEQPSSASSQPQAGQSGKPQSSAANSKNSPASGGESTSLADKMRDAMANLMSKLKPSPKSQEGQQSASNGQQGSAKRQQQEMSQRGMQGQNKAQGDGQANPDQQGDQDGEPNDKGQSSQGKGGDKNGDRQNNQDSKSGVGKQDGNKDLRDAEQLAAMGKISELLGKRSAQVTGEMTVEVPAGKQQLRTNYTQRKALHADAGGEVNRDEIPLMYQGYVQRYFEEVRKATPKTRN